MNSSTRQLAPTVRLMGASRRDGWRGIRRTLATEEDDALGPVPAPFALPIAPAERGGFETYPDEQRKDSPTTVHSDDWLLERGGFEKAVSREAPAKENLCQDWENCRVEDH
jgi:hypothetical protein